MSVQGPLLARATNALAVAGRVVIRYGLVVVLLWIGTMKFSAEEAEGVVGLAARSPLMSWGYSVWSVRGFSDVLGVTEIAIATLVGLVAIDIVTHRPSGTSDR